MSRWALLATALCAACSEHVIRSPDPVPPAAPPGDDDDEGDPPDWNTCDLGWRGTYSNLQVHHPYVTPRPNDAPAPTEPDQLDFWDDPTFEQYEGSLDFGSNWWPVDEGLEGDPAYFAAYFHAWIRAWSDTTLTFTLGSADDSWVLVQNEIVASQPGIHEFVREPYDVYVDAGQYPIEVYFAHRASDVAGFSFRVISGDVSICYPEFEEDEGTQP